MMHSIKLKKMEETGLNTYKNEGEQDDAAKSTSYKL